jgi:GT2 family glycosyltransferase
LPETPETVSCVVVSFSDPTATRRAVDSLLAQSEAPIEVLLVDNHPDAPAVAYLDRWEKDGRVRLVHGGQNLGYTVACNRAAAQARGDWLFFLNPDARADPDCLRTLLRGAKEHTAVLGAQILLPDGRTNAGDNPLHITGVAWAGRFGEPREHGPPREVAAVSGAGLLARRADFREIGGLCEGYFLYQDDADLCWRTRMTGCQVVFCPEAIAWHDYEFEKGAGKWYWLERNRLWCVLSNYSVTSLLLLLPLLLGAELVVAGRALRGRRIGGLVRAWGSIVRSLPELLRWRARVQARRRVPDSELMSRMTGHFQTALLHSPATTRAGLLMELYRRGVIRVLRAVGQ